MHAPARLLLKLSGEALSQQGNGPLHSESLQRITQEIVGLKNVGIGLVVGGGNIIRGGRSRWIDRIEADTVGMLSTVVNALALRSFFQAEGKQAIVQSAISTELTTPVSARAAREAISSGTIVIFAGGTGNPLVTTDTAAAIRGAAIGADLLAKGSNVAGVFSKDPKRHGPTATGSPLQEITFDTYIRNRYEVMDLVAVEICRENNLPIVVFDLSQPGALEKVTAGKKVGTLIH